MPSSVKRKELTADDLLREQEQPSRKRARLKRRRVPKNREESGDTGVESDEAEETHSAVGEDESLDASDSDGIDDEGQSKAHGQSFDFERVHVEDRFRRVRPQKAEEDAKLRDSSSFASLGASVALQNALSMMSIRIPTPVQAACIPALLEGRDCIGNAKTGSGKTIAFALPILQKLSVDPYGIFALVLTPTRELAFQISEQFAVLGVSLNVRTAVVVGGMDMMAQALELENRPHVVVATPGRIVDHLRTGAAGWDLSRVKFLVLDEADRLLSPTFTPELEHLFGVLPRNRQTCLFTATWTPSIEGLANATPRPGKQKPFIHRMTEAVETVSTLRQRYLLVPSHVREVYLHYLLCNPPDEIAHMRRAPPEPSTSSRKSKVKPKKGQEDDMVQPPSTIIFCRKPKTAAYLTSMLKTLSIRSTALHSRLTQRERLSSLSLFRASVVPVLVSTDVGARGLDIEEVALVVNWDMPDSAEEYTHRVGRTARAGRGGMAVSFVTERDEERVLAVEERIGLRLEELVLPEERVLERLNGVSTAKRLARMELHDGGFGRREAVRAVKARE